MKKFIDTIKAIFSIDELRNRILYTFGFLLVFRLGSYIYLPGIDPSLLQKDNEGILGFINTFVGGAFERASLFALGIMPYISASIVIQLLTVAVPYFQKLQKEGESGRKKVTQITRVLTIIITLAQGSTYVAAYIDPTVYAASGIAPYFIPLSVIILTTGTMFCMWLGERITERGIGNGISMLIMIGIISSFPAAIYKEIEARNLLLFIIEGIALFFIVMAVVLLTQAVRKIQIQYAKQVVGGRSTQLGKSQRSYLPLKVNSANVMPIIFAQSLMFLPSLIAKPFADTSEFANAVQVAYADFTSWPYNLTIGILILVFTFFYTAITINPSQMKDDLKRSGAFIPGVKPGQPTADYIATILDRITLPGAFYLAIVAILPAFASMAGVTPVFSQFYGGTSLIIMVGVILDTLQQINSYLLMRQYDGLMKSGGKMKGRSQAFA